ncbi:MAG: BspA family leucine-rich repeat surface protein [Mediterranea massiliensis]|nr:BspA family leucine-rich repeat surface protein [Mediterranea massiliensis]
MKIFNLIKGITMLCLPLFLFSCSEEEYLQTEQKVKVLISIDEFQNDAATRTTTDPNNNYAITWASGDTIGIFPREGFQEPFEIPANQVGQKSATFDGGYWTIKGGLTYNAYYPFDKNAFLSADEKTRIAVTYLGQEQTGTECNIGAYDYTYSDWKEAAAQSISFKFHHIGAIAIFSLEYPATTTYTKFSITTEEKVIPVAGTYDLTADAPIFVADKYAKSIDMALKNHEGTAGDIGKFYMMLPPMDLSGHEVTLSLTQANGTKHFYSIAFPTIVKSKKYELEGDLITTSADGSTDEWEDETKSVELNGTTFKEKLIEAVGKDEWEAKRSISSIIFKANSTPSANATIVSDGIAINYADNIATVHINADYANLTTGKQMFNGLSHLKHIEGLNIINTSNVTDMSEMFRGCSLLTSLDLSNFDTSNVTDMEFMFSDCSSLTTLNLSNFDTSNVTDMGNMFSYCQSLTILDLSNFDTSNVTNMSSMFYDCHFLATLNLSNFDTSNVTDMGYMFSFCHSLATLNLSNFDTSNVTDMGNMFSFCQSLTILDLSNFDTSNVTDMSGMFYACSTLTSLDLSNFDTSNVTDMSGMFYAYSLTSLDLSNFDTSNVTNMNGMFSGCSLTSLDLSNFDTSKVTNMNCMFSGCWSLTTLNLSNFDTSNVTDMSNMFSYCQSLATLDLSNFNTSNVTDLSDIFSNCLTLKALNISNFDFSKMTSISELFKDCISLTSLDVSNVNTSNITNMNRLFQNCSSLISLDLSSFDTSKVTNMHEMFRNCSSLVSIDLSNFDTDNVENMGWMFNGCSKLTSVKMMGNTSNLRYATGFFPYTTNTGTFYYNEAYDYSKIIAELPNAWTAIPCAVTE